jgi:hypothetical protein
MNIVKILKQVAEELDGRFTNTYSGRCMYGKKCCGITTDEPLQTVMQIGYLIGTNNLGDCDQFSPRMDSMGRSTIVYFPDIQDDGEEDEENDSCPDCGYDDCQC